MAPNENVRIVDACKGESIWCPFVIGAAHVNGVLEGAAFETLGIDALLGG